MLAEAGGLGTAEAEGSEAAEAEVLFPKEAMLCAENSAPRPPTHHGAQLGDGPHSPVGWWAARSTAGLYGARDAKSSRTRSPGTGPRGQQPPCHQAATRQDRASRKQGARTAQVPTLRDSGGPCTRRQPPAYPSSAPLDLISQCRIRRRLTCRLPTARGLHGAFPQIRGSAMKSVPGTRPDWLRRAAPSTPQSSDPRSLGRRHG